MPLDKPPPRENRFGSPLELSRVHWVRPEVVVEVTYLEKPEPPRKLLSPPTRNAELNITLEAAARSPDRRRRRGVVVARRSPAAVLLALLLDPALLQVGGARIVAVELGEHRAGIGLAAEHRQGEA